VRHHPAGQARGQQREAVSVAAGLQLVVAVTRWQWRHQLIVVGIAADAGVVARKAQGRILQQADHFSAARRSGSL
jgi:hypothetical protein